MPSWMLLAAITASLASALDLTNAHVVAPAGMNRQESKAVQMLVEEVEKRSQIHLPTIAAGTGPAITITRGRGPAEGYTISVASNAVSIAMVLGTMGGMVCHPRDDTFERSEARLDSEFMRATENPNQFANEANERP